jgi:hypothetical protein
MKSLPVRFYRAFGMVIRSELALDGIEEIPECATADVTVSNGPVPAALDGLTGEGRAVQLVPGRFLFRIRDVAAYLVENGETITVGRVPGRTDSEVSGHL